MSTSERLHLARELHDGIAQDLVGLGYSLDLLIAQDHLPLETRSALRTSRLEIDQLMEKVRREIFNLRKPLSQTLHSALEELVKQQRGDFTINLEMGEVDSSPEVAAEIIAIATELLRNIGLHARASHVDVKLYPVNNRICLQISDDGIGGVMLKDGHWGIAGITERVNIFNGSIAIEDYFQDSKGVRITVLL
jgi:two-component system, NarL family, sensor histidine kinase LiaS